MAQHLFCEIIGVLLRLGLPDRQAVHVVIELSVIVLAHCAIADMHTIAGLAAHHCFAKFQGVFTENEAGAHTDGLCVAVGGCFGANGNQLFSGDDVHGA